MTKEDKLGYLQIDSSFYKTRIDPRFENRIQYMPSDPKIILSFIPGTVTQIYVTEGQIVKKGEELMILDAMKMQNKLKCSMDGKIKSIAVTIGTKVSKGTILIELE
jgi:biotin carboxyl carrier protein